MIPRRNFLTGLGAACGCVMVGMPTPTRAGTDASFDVICAGARRAEVTGGRPEIEPAPEAAEMVRRMTQSIGLDVPFTVGKSKVASGAYAARRGGELLIVYDRDSYDFKGGRFSYESLFVFAHEIGHHVAHPHLPRRGGSTHPKEKAADRFAGASLARLGASLDQALSWPRGASELGSKSHPPRAERIAAAEAGWHEAQAQMRWQNTAHCKPGWQGREFDMDGQICRIARSCGDDGPEMRVACETSSGRWIWR